MGSQEPLALPCVFLKGSKTPSHRAISPTQRERDHNRLISLKRRRILPFIVSDQVQTEANLEEQRWKQAYTPQPLSLFLASAEGEDRDLSALPRSTYMLPSSKQNTHFPLPLSNTRRLARVSSSRRSPWNATPPQLLSASKL